MITGQKAVATKSQGHLRTSSCVPEFRSACASLSGRRTCTNSLDRLISVALPRIRDFRGINPKGFDGSGNYTLGV